MVMLSQLLRCGLEDRRGRRARLSDLAVNLASGDYPEITHLICRPAGGGALVRLPWAALRRLDARDRRGALEDLEAGEPDGEDWPPAVVLLKRDILDALVIDLKDHLALRANDLWLAEEGGRLTLTGIDVSLAAILRRLSGGLAGRLPGRLRDWRAIEFLRGDPAAARAGRDYHGLIGRLPAGEIANLAGAVPYLHAAELVTLLPDAKAADTLESLIPERQLQVFEELADDQAGRLIALMRPDIVADLLGRLKPDRAHYWLEHMARPQYARVVRLLAYPEDTAGGIMTNEMLVLPEALTVDAALAGLREQLRQPGGGNFIQMVYIVGGESGRRLAGVISLRDLLIAESGQTLAEIMKPYVITLQPLESAANASQRVIDNELAGIPVVDESLDLLGVVTIDSALAQTIPAIWGGRDAPRLFS